ncbi:uncharacterized protein LOC109714363 isoform X2 [Ananas comosus]|uniref:Uncharacterized protein LOC109714363 isoform X2 n=1 Tax=Ananas comosus TaxID=4615 RepID=A0A6P5FG56_ANACO|nr:uncharacterized protein LOC109714363 isoform X2 [Ananas comosus]
MDVVSLWQTWGEGGKGGVVQPAIGSMANWLYKVVEPAPPRICGSEGGPPVTAQRIQLRDGRYLAYSESGVPKDKARLKIVFSHGFTGNRTDTLRASQELVEELGVYMVGFDRAGYGESDANPNRSVRSAASDLTELADALDLGPKFYLVGFSLGNHAVWGALKYFPERIAGAALLAPVINYRWPGFPRDLADEAYSKQELGDQWALRVSYYAPSILHWWMEQSWLPTSTAVKGTTYLPNKLDQELRTRSVADGSFDKRRQLATQQGIYESFYRDMKVMFGKWDFDPMDLSPPPFPVHVWQGDEDGLVPVVLQRHIASRHSWINYHELPGTGHFLTSVPGLGDKVLKALFSHPPSE